MTESEWVVVLGLLPDGDLKGATVTSRYLIDIVTTVLAYKLLDAVRSPLLARAARKTRMMFSLEICLSVFLFMLSILAPCCKRHSDTQTAFNVAITILSLLDSTAEH